MRPRLLHVLLAATVIGCAEPNTSLTAPTLAPGQPARDFTDPCYTGMVDQKCEGEPEYGIGSWRFFAPVNDVLYQAPGDPSPNAAGIWLGASVTPAACFNDRTPYITDVDHDWLDDGCELELARGFAPRWSMGPQDECPDGEPAWAAKYFPAAGAVRIAFMPAYYDDCGGDTFLNIGPAHHGDSEFAMVEVIFNASTQHWQFAGMWLSAHYETSGDRSQWVPPYDADFTVRYLAHPFIAVSANKHANYQSNSKCNNTIASAAGYGDNCYPSTLTPFRFPIDPGRNAGSRFVDRMGCVASIKRFAGNGRTECFYTPQPFNGWYPPNYLQPGVSPYSGVLRSDKFEYRFGDPGPGPAPYSAPPPYDPPPVGGCANPTQIICTDW
jgi:hypothetical protein